MSTLSYKISKKSLKVFIWIQISIEFHMPHYEIPHPSSCYCIHQARALCLFIWCGQQRSLLRMPIISSLGTFYSLLLRWAKRPFASSMAIAVNEMDDDIVLGLLVKLQAPQPVEIDINKKLLPKQKTIHTFNTDA